MPESGGDGRKVRSTRTPVCRPTPVVLIELLSVRCLSMAGVASSLTSDAIHAPGQGVSRGQYYHNSSISACRERCCLHILDAFRFPAFFTAPPLHLSTFFAPSPSSICLFPQKRRNVRRIETRGGARGRRLRPAAADHRGRTLQAIVVDRVGGGRQAVGARALEDVLDDLQSRLSRF